jgi:hypothetical protein
LATVSGETVSGETVSKGELRVYASRRRQWLLAGGLLGVFLATLSLVLEPDPSTGQKPLPGDYLWVVIPGLLVLAVLVWRAFKARVETDTGGVGLYRVVGHDYFPWSDIRGFEVLPTPSRQGFSVRIRRQNETLVTVRNEILIRPVRRRDEARLRARGRAQAFREVLDSDRRSRLSAGRDDPRSPGPSGSTGPTEPRATEPGASRPGASRPAASGSAASGPAASGPAGTGSAGTGSAGTGSAGTGPSASEPFGPATN